MPNNHRSSPILLSSLSIVAGVGNLVGRDKLLLDRPQTDEAGQQVATASLVVGTTGTGTTEGLLADNSTSALAVDVEVTGSVAQGIVGDAENLAVLGEDGAGQTVVAGLVDLLADLGKVGLGGIGVGVDDQDGTEELAGEERVVGVAGVVDGGLDVPSLGGIVGTAGQQLQLGVVLGLIDHVGQLVEGGLVDDRTAEVGEVRGLADLDVLGLGNNVLDELVGDGRGHVGTGGGTALLALELEGSADSLDSRVADIGGLVDQVEVLTTGLTNNAGVAAVLALGDAVGDLAVEAAEHSSATGEVKGSKVGVVENGVGDLRGVTGDELDDVLGQTGLEEDLVDEPVGSDGGRRRLPDDNVTHQGGSTSQVTANGSEVERTDGVDESLQRTVFNTAGPVSFRSINC